MESALLFWWVAFGLVIVSSTVCARKGIQPNPMYRTAQRLAAGGKEITGFVAKRVATTASLASMIGSLLFGVIVYYVVLRCMC